MTRHGRAGDPQRRPSVHPRRPPASGHGAALALLQQRALGRPETAGGAHELALGVVQGARQDVAAVQ
jgi:hypothetical protein